MRKLHEDGQGYREPSLYPEWTGTVPVPGNSCIIMQYSIPWYCTYHTSRLATRTMVLY